MVVDVEVSVVEYAEPATTVSLPLVASTDIPSSVMY